MIKGRYTPWDESALKLKTFEILEIDTCEQKEVLDALRNNSFCEANLIYGRFPSNNFLIKELLIKSGYIPCETSFKVTLASLSDYILPRIYERRKLEISKINRDEFSDVADISRNMFNYSRFHEDPFINKDLANNRMYLWVKDLANQDVSCLVNRSKVGDVISFMFYKTNERMQVELILGGSKKGFEMHSPFFWGSVIYYLKLNGATRISTTISAANSGVISLYQNLGFKIVSTNIDYHKHL
ncbi:hypothetical protein VXM60_13300 [Shewanella khirikhana]|uniref:hypothetical protein n=1 Tax=Shewanella khirikhana TaxID=1965282 RepID=UPI0030D58218